MMTVFETIEQDNKRIFMRGRREGREEGRKIGEQDGKRQSKVEIIKNMLKENLPTDLISKITGISQQQINKMK